MKTKYFLLITALLFQFSMNLQGAESSSINIQIKNKVQALLDSYADADDLMDKNLLQQRAELESLGEKAYPALCEILSTNDNPMYLASVVDVFLRSDGNKNEPLKVVRNLLIMHRDGKYSPAHQAALKFLAEYGSEEDVALIAEYANVHDIVTKTIARESKARIEDREEVRRLLPTGPDMEDPNDLGKYQQLIEMGESAYPALAELLKNTTDDIVISRILAVFTQSKGDKTIAKNAARQLLERKYDNAYDEGKIRILVARMLEEIGGAADAEMLYPMLDDRAEFVRVNAIRALAKIGDEKAIQQIEQFAKKIEANTYKDEIRNDTSLQEGNKAIEVIRNRLAETTDSTLAK